MVENDSGSGPAPNTSGAPLVDFFKSASSANLTTALNAEPIPAAAPAPAPAPSPGGSSEQGAGAAKGK